MESKITNTFLFSQSKFLQPSRKLFVTHRTKCLANLIFCAGHFRLLSYIFELRVHIFLTGHLGALRQTFSKYVGHVQK